VLKYIVTPPYVFMASYLAMNRDNFTFTIYSWWFLSSRSCFSQPPRSPCLSRVIQGSI
jgi:hypothetical protein